MTCGCARRRSTSTSLPSGRLCHPASSHRPRLPASTLGHRPGHPSRRNSRTDLTATRWQTTGALLAAVLTCATVLAMPLRASADTGSDLRVLSRVRAICDGAPPGATAAARQAVAVLSQGLAESQPELD